MMEILFQEAKNPEARNKLTGGRIKTPMKLRYAHGEPG
jgi:hypothetical protein